MLFTNLKSIVYVMLCFTIISCKKNAKYTQTIVSNNIAAFDWFHYEGKDDIFKTFTKTDSTYLNPIISGFYPDPSICSAQGKFYLVNSSFAYFPGIPIFESTDLVHWKQIGHVITRKEQIDLSGLGVSQGIFAPTIRYHNGTFYVICTSVNAGGNFIVTAKDPAGSWSEPIWLPEIDGIDPDIFFDDDSKVYITHNGPPPNNETKHEGHRAIYMFEYDLEKQAISSESKLLVNGGTSMAIKPVWIEAPHIFKKDGYYYLICAQGGTGYNHSEVVFRSKTIFGPYVSYENNPILTQRHLDTKRSNPISSTGHADFVKTENGEWWAVFLGCRPYDVDFYNTGRETFLMPLVWNDGWPVIINGNDPLPIVNKKPHLKPGKVSEATTGNFISHDDFNNSVLDFKWNFIRTPIEKWYTIENGHLNIAIKKESAHSQLNFSFIGRRQQHLDFEASTKFNFKNTNIRQAVGLMAFQNEEHYIFIGKHLNASGDLEVFVERKTAKNNATIITKQFINKGSETLFLKIEGNKQFYNFYYKTSDIEDWLLLAKKVDAKNLSTKEAHGFVGTYLAMYGSENHFHK